MKAGQCIAADVGQFVNEAASAIESEDRNQAKGNRENSRLTDNRPGECAVADNHRCQKISPVNCGLRRVEITRDLGRSADQVDILGNWHSGIDPARVCRSRWRIFRRDGCRTHKHLHNCWMA